MKPSTHGATQAARPSALLAVAALVAGCRANAGDGGGAGSGKGGPGGDGDSAASWFAFAPVADAFEPAALDLRSLNERRAGDAGFIGVKGASFVARKSGQPIRFWGVNARHDVLELSPAATDRLARHLAKVGVNLLRLHGPLWRDVDPTRLDEGKLDRIHRLLAALAKQGIYLELSSYFPLWLHPRGLPGIEGYEGDKSAFGLAFFNPRFEAIQRGWLKAALTTRNPYTGHALVDDPALAFVEIQNEDSLFFWTFAPYDSLPAPQMAILETRFGAWLAARYGDLPKALARWRGGRIRGDDVAAGRAGFMAMWEMTSRRDERAQDTAQFLAEVQRDYYDRMTSYLKKELGFKGSVTASNWVTADGRRLGPLDKWSNAGADFMDRHGYYGGPHEGPNASFALSVGDRYRDVSALRFESGKNETSFDLPIMDLAYDGKPSTVSELNWPMPNRYRTEMSMLCAAYGALQGTDGFMFFTTEEPEWAGELTKFAVSDPAVMGQFPAAAVVFRKGLIRTAEPVVHLALKLGDLNALQGLPLAVPENLDELRKVQLPFLRRTRAAPSPETIDPLAYLVGRVEVDITAAGGPSRVIPLSGFIDREKETVRSSTHELGWDWNHGVATLDAPAAQGAVGFLAKAGTIPLRDIAVTSTMEYGSIVVVALDDRPLQTSRKMLLQVMSETRNSGWSAPGDGMRVIAAVGTSPIMVKKFAGQVVLRRADARSLEVRALDPNGRATGTTQVASDSGALTLAPATLYWLIEK